MNKSLKNLTPIFLLVVLIIVSSFGAFIYMRQNNKREWNYYENQITGYKVVYPEDWSVDANDATMVNFISPDASLIKGGDDYGDVISIASSYTTYPTKLEDQFSFYINNSNFSLTPYTLNGLAATKFEALTNEYPGTNFIALAKDEGKVFIRIYYSGEEENKSVYETVLSSFQLIPSSKDVNYDNRYEYESYNSSPHEYSISDWRTYINDQYAFSVNYPRQWERYRYASDTEDLLLGESFQPINSSQRVHPPSFTLFVYPIEIKSIDTYLTDPNSKLISKEEMVIGGKDGVFIEMERKSSPIPIPSQKYWLVEKNNNLYVITVSIDGSNEKIFDTFLNSFKLL